MNKKSSTPMIIAIIAIIAILLALVLCHKKSPGYRVYFGNLSDGANVESPFKVEMKSENLVVEPAANGVVEGHGHFHILIDTAPSAIGEPVPMDASHLHFGKGQVETTLDLPEGDHTLILQFASGNHYPYDPQVTQTVHIRVTKQNPPPAALNPETHGTEEMKMDTVVNSSGAMTLMKANKSKNVKGKAKNVKPETLPNTPPPINPGMGNGMGGNSGGMGGAGGH